MPDSPKQTNSVRKVFSVIGIAVGIFGVGLGMLLTGWHPRSGVTLMAVGVAYLLWELLNCPPLVRIVPEGMLRFLMGVMIGAFIILIAGPDIERTIHRIESPPLPQTIVLHEHEQPNPSVPLPAPHSPPEKIEKAEPQLTLQAGESMNPKYAFETRFILDNHGPLSIKEASYICRVTNIFPAPASMLHLTPGTPPLALPDFFGPIGDVEVDRQFSVYCDATAAEFLLGEPERMDINIVVNYKYKNKLQQQIFSFLTMRKPDGTYGWLPRGAPK